MGLDKYKIAKIIMYRKIASLLIDWGMVFVPIIFVSYLHFGYIKPIFIYGGFLFVMVNTIIVQNRSKMHTVGDSYLKISLGPISTTKIPKITLRNVIINISFLLPFLSIEYGFIAIFVFITFIGLLYPNKHPEYGYVSLLDIITSSKYSLKK